MTLEGTGQHRQLLYVILRQNGTQICEINLQDLTCFDTVHVMNRVILIAFLGETGVKTQRKKDKFLCSGRDYLLCDINVSVSVN